MSRNEDRRFRFVVPAVKLALVALAVLTTVSLAPAAPGKDKDQDEFTQVYRHTYDEVFQASQEAIERKGLFVVDQNKDKGVITGNGKYSQQGGCMNRPIDFDIQIESVNPKPETRITLNIRLMGKCIGGGREFRKMIANDLLVEIQKVLATYH